MTSRVADLRQKEVISVRDGQRLGPVCDVELDVTAARLKALVIYGRPRLLGLLGRAPDRVIPWEEVQLIGEETVLVSGPGDLPPAPRRLKFLEKIGIFREK